MSIEGFVTIGRGELLLSLLSVAVLMCVVGWAAGQIVMMIRRPAPIKLRPITPADEERGRKMLREMCPGPHCDDNKQMASWLAGKDFRLITNEVYQALTDEARIQRFEWPAENEFKTRAQPQWPTGAARIRPAFDLGPSLIETLKAAMAKPHPAPTTADENATIEWPSDGDPDDV